MKTDSFAIYKGLQRPLTFKAFKGKFIYYAACVLIGSVIIAGLVTAVVSAIAGLIVLFISVVPGLMYIISSQKNGLYNKKRDTAIYLRTPLMTALTKGKKYEKEEI